MCTVPWPNLPSYTGENTGCVKPWICGPINTSPFFFRRLGPWVTTLVFILLGNKDGNTLFMNGWISSRLMATSSTASQRLSITCVPCFPVLQETNFYWEKKRWTCQAASEWNLMHTAQLRLSLPVASRILNTENLKQLVAASPLNPVDVQICVGLDSVRHIHTLWSSRRCRCSWPSYPSCLFWCRRSRQDSAGDYAKKLSRKVGFLQHFNLFRLLLTFTL